VRQSRATLTTAKKFDFWGRICYTDSVKQNKATEMIRALCFVLGEMTEWQL